jgi:hypothetical protein
MTTSFGPLETCGPTRRTYIPGKFATKRFDSISGAGTTRLYGSKAFDAQLKMTFVLSDADTCAFLKCWEAAYGDYDTLTLPAEFFAGASAALDRCVPDYLNWRWADAPSVESLFPGRSRVQVNLIATLDA